LRIGKVAGVVAVREAVQAKGTGTLAAMAQTRFARLMAARLYQQGGEDGYGQPSPSIRLANE